MSELDKLPVERAIFWLLRDALKYARLDVFGGYLNEHSGLDLVNYSEIPDHRDVLLKQLGISAVGYLHATTVAEEPYDRIAKLLAEINEISKEDEVAP